MSKAEAKATSEAGDDEERGTQGEAPERALALYRELLRIRRFEEELQKLLSQGKVGGTTHLCLGQEAVPVGVSSQLSIRDQVVSTHRGHGHLLAKGARMDRALAEIAGRIDGYCRGKGGSQHVAVPEIGHMGSNGITGGGLPIGAGLALARKLLAAGKSRQSQDCVVLYFGDGAADTGNFHETLNLAALWKLPALFVLENNHYAMSTPTSKSSACRSFEDWASRYEGFRTARVDGNDVLAVAEQAGALLAHVRAGEGPAFLECDTYRQCGHSKSDARVYRSREEEAEWRGRDPLVLLEKRASLAADAIDEIRARVEEEVQAAVDFAMQSPPGDRSVALAGLDLHVPKRVDSISEVEEGTELSLTEAIRDVLLGELERDASVVLVGEDIGAYGGAFGVTRGFLERFGEERIRETPICESSFVGLSVGAAMGGLRPVAELMFGDFAACCMDALTNHAAKLRYMYDEQVEVPFTLRMPVGRRHGYGGTHSQSLEAWFVHVPGLSVAFPATLEDAVGLLRTSIRTNAPVLFLEHKLLYPAKGRMPGPRHVVPLGKARLDRRGRDLSIVCYGHALLYVREAAELLEQQGHSVEVIDLRSLQPFDREAVVQSVQKTGRMLFVQEASVVGGVCDRVIADVLPDVFPYLHAPIERVGMEHCPFPSSPALEDLVLPSAERVHRKALRLLTGY